MARSILSGTLRVGNGLSLKPAGPTPPQAPGGPPPGGPTPYVEALAKLFPVEGVTLAPMVPVIADGDKGLTLFLVAIIVVLIILLRMAATRPEAGGPPDWLAIAVSVISFLLYAATLEIFGVFVPPPERQALLMAFLTVVWVAIVPLIPQRS